MSEKYQLRRNKLEKAIAQGISQIILIEIDDERLKNEMISISKVKLNEDFSYGTVFFKILNPEKKNKVIKLLYQSAGYLRSQLTKKVLMKNIPQLKFFYDYNEEENVKNLIEKLSTQYNQDASPLDANSEKLKTNI